MLLSEFISLHLLMAHTPQASGLARKRSTARALRARAKIRLRTRFSCWVCCSDQEVSLGWAVLRASRSALFDADGETHPAG